MVLRTSHAAILSLPLQILAAALSPIAGHTIDPATVDFTMVFTVIIAIADWLKRHYAPTTTSELATVTVKPQA